MSDKQLTVAELLAKAGKDSASTSAPRTRRRRSMDSGGISVAELTGNIPKVNAKPQEARHSSEPIDVEDNKPEQLDVATLQEAARKEAESRLQPKQQLEHQAEPEPEPEPEAKLTQFEAITVDRPSNAETIVLSVVDEDAPLRLTTDTFSVVGSESVVEAPAEDLAKPVDAATGNALLTMAEESLAEAIDEAHTTESAVVEEAAALVGSEATMQYDPFFEEDDYVDSGYDESDFEDADNTDTTFIDTGFISDADYVEEDFDEEPATQVFEATLDHSVEPVTTVDEFANANFKSSRMAFSDETVANLPVIEEEPEEDYYEQDYQEELVPYPTEAAVVAEDYEDEEDEKMSIFAVLGMSLVGILVGAGIFYGFQYLWGAMDNRLIVAGLAAGVTLVLVTIVHFMRTDRDILSKVLAFIVGIAMTFGPLLIVGF